jgi:hypothetical protein
LTLAAWNMVDGDRFNYTDAIANFHSFSWNISRR